MLGSFTSSEDSDVLFGHLPDSKMGQCYRERGLVSLAHYFGELVKLVEFPEWIASQHCHTLVRSFKHRAAKM